MFQDVDHDVVTLVPRDAVHRVVQEVVTLELQDVPFDVERLVPLLFPTLVFHDVPLDVLQDVVQLVVAIVAPVIS